MYRKNANSREFAGMDKNKAVRTTYVVDVQELFSRKIKINWWKGEEYREQ